MSNISKLEWNKVDWKKIESRVFRIQRRIYKAKTEKKVNAIHYLQKKIINSIEAKIIAIREANKLKKSYWIKKIYFNTRKKKVKLAYQLKLKKNPKLENVIKESIMSIKDEAAQFLIKLSLEPEWAPMLEPNSMGHQLGQSYQDTIENIISNQEFHIKYIFQTYLFEGPQYFNRQRFLKKLNSIKIIEIQIKKWINLQYINEFEKKKIYSYNDLEVEKIYKNPITQLISDIAFNGLETYLIQIINAETKKEAKPTIIGI